MATTNFQWKIIFWIIFTILFVQLVGFLTAFLVSPETLHTIRKVQFSLTFELLLSMGSFLIWHRCVNVISSRKFGNGQSSLIDDGLKALLTFFLILVHFSFFMYYLLAATEPHYFAVLSFVCLGLYVHLIILTVFFTALEFLCGIFFSSTSGRGWLLVNSALHTSLSIVASVIVTAFCLWITTWPPFVKHESITLTNLPRHLDGLTVTLVADLHVGPTVGRSRLEKAVNIINQLNSDIVAVSGDLVDGSDETFSNAVDSLRNIRSKYGIFYATGNHEYYHAIVDRWFVKFRSLGINVLHNSNVQLKLSNDKSTDDGSVICMAGVDDISSRWSGQPGHGMNATAALSGCDRRKGPVIMLVHQPNGAKVILDSKPNRQIDLVLCGHTHGGQFYILAPFAYLANSYYWGLYRHQSGSQIYVTSGVYFWGPPMKMYRLSEIVKITLHSGDAVA